MALLAGPALNLVESVATYGESDLREPLVGPINMTQRPDIWFIVLDGYPGKRSLELAHDNQLDEELVATLSNVGFEIPDSVWSSYPTTEFSVASMFSMGHLATEWDGNEATSADLHRIIGGDNALVRILNENGYHTVMLESGWSGSSCGAEFDLCVGPPFHDTSIDVLLNTSILGAEPFARPAVSFAESSLSTMDHLLEQDALRLNAGPTFVYGHLLAPHPPFFPGW